MPSMWLRSEAPAKGHNGSSARIAFLNHFVGCSNHPGAHKASATSSLRGSSALHAAVAPRWPKLPLWVPGHPLRPARPARPDRAVDLRSLRGQPRRPGQGTRPAGPPVGGKGGRVVLVPLPPAVARAIDRAVDDRASGPILLNTVGVRMDRHAAARRLKCLASTAGIWMPRTHSHMLRRTFVTTRPDVGVRLRNVQIAASHADPRTTI
jgi:integrase